VKGVLLENLAFLDMALHESVLALEEELLRTGSQGLDVSHYFESATAEQRSQAAMDLLAASLGPAEAATADHQSWLASMQDRLPVDIGEMNPLLERYLPEVARRFELVRLIGSGGMGMVYEVIDRERGSTLAMKILHRPIPELLLSFKREFRSLTYLAHPHLVRLYEYFHWEKLSCFTMEFVRGTNLLTWWKEQPARPLPAICTAFSQLAEGLHQLHVDGKLHRDVKPSNVMVAEADQRVVVLDFGLVTNYVERLGLFNPEGCDFAGTIAYMAPEQMRGQALSAPCDWYAYGVLLYEVLVGQRPFKGSYTAISQLKAQGAFDPLPEELPASLRTLCTQLLRPDPRDRPGIDAIRLALSAPRGPLVRPPELLEPTASLLGRDGEMGELWRACEESRAGASHLALVHGISGIGKSALLDKFRHELLARYPDTAVFSGRCYEQESIPYKGIDEIVDQLSVFLSQLPASELRQILPADFGILAGVFPVLHLVANRQGISFPSVGKVTDPALLRRRMLTAVKDLVANLGARGPIVMIIDDLQWCDTDCVAILKAILKLPAEGQRLLVIGSFRRDEAARNQALASLHEELTKPGNPGWSDIAVDELSDETLHELSLKLIGSETAAASPEAIQRIVREAHGSPFFLMQLAAALEQGGEDLELASILQNRLHGLGEVERAFLQLVAVAGRPVPRHILIEAAGLPSNYHEVESNLRLGRWVKSSGPKAEHTLESYHDRIREGVVHGLDDATQRARHLQLADVLEHRARDDFELLAFHNRGAGRLEKAGQFYEMAGEGAAEVLAFERAVEFYRTSMECRPTHGEPGAKLRQKLAEALVNLGRGGEAGAEYATAAGQAPREMQPSLERMATYQYLVSGHLKEAKSGLERLTARAGITVPNGNVSVLLSQFRRAWVQLRGLGFKPQSEAEIPPAELERIDSLWAVALGIGLNDAMRAADLQARGLLWSLRLGEPRRIVRALALDAVYVSAWGHRTGPRVQHLLKVAEDAARLSPIPSSEGLIGFSRGATSWFLADFETAYREALRAHQLFREHVKGALWEIDSTGHYILLSLIFLGDLGALNRAAHLLLDGAEARGDLHMAAHVRCFALPWIHLGLDQPDTATEVAEDSIVSWNVGRDQKRTFQLQDAQAWLSLCEADIYRGRGDLALRRIRSERFRYMRSGFYFVQMVHNLLRSATARASLLEAYRLGSKGEAALRGAERMARQCCQGDNPYGAALGNGFWASIHAARGNTGRAITCLQTAIALADECHAGLLRSCFEHRLGQLRGGEEGKRLMEIAKADLTSKGVVNPEKMARSFLPLNIDSRPLSAPL